MHGDRKQAVVAGAGLGRDAIGHFALDHQDGTIQDWTVGRGVAGGEFAEDLRGDAVGQVAEDEQGLAGGGRGRGKIEVEHVLLDDGDAGCTVGGKLGAEMGGEAGVQFDGENMGGAGGQGSGDGAGAGADFDYGAAGKIAQRGGDALDGLRIVEEVLSEPGFGGHGLVLMVDEGGRLGRLGGKTGNLTWLLIRPHWNATENPTLDGMRRLVSREADYAVPNPLEVQKEAANEEEQQTNHADGKAGDRDRPGLGRPVLPLLHAQRGRGRHRDRVRLRPGVEATEAEIRAFCQGQIAYYKIPEHIRFVDDFPATLSGKIQKYKIREFEIEARGLQSVASAATA